MTPVGAIGDSDPSVGTVADHDGHQEGGDPDLTGDGHGHRRDQGGRRDIARADRRQDKGEEEEHYWHHANISSTVLNRPVGDPVQRSVRLCLREQQRHAGQREKESGREPSHDIVGAHASHVDADDPSQCDGEEAHMQPDRAAHDDGDEQSAE